MREFFYKRNNVVTMAIESILNQNDLSQQDICELLSAESEEELRLIKNKAFSVLGQYCGSGVYLRGLIEFSNVCANDCLYCGIRKSNVKVARFTVDKSKIVETAIWCAEQGFGSIVLQSGERQDERFILDLEDIIKSVKIQSKSEKLPNGLGITLSCGEQTLDTYTRWFYAGAHRYLLRIETSSPELFRQIHPQYQTFENRLKALDNLRIAGFQVGTGVMIGLPMQTIENLADDIIFFKNRDIDMIGMGPYIPHKDTPMNIYSGHVDLKSNFLLALKMIAVTRIVLKDVNIAAATALQAIEHDGREQGLSCGANIIMPLATPVDFRREYQLYEGKPCLDEMSEQCSKCVVQRVKLSGLSVVSNEYGDSKHFEKRKSS